MVLTNETHLTGSQVEDVLMKAYKKTQNSKVELYILMFLSSILLISCGFGLNNNLYKVSGFALLFIGFALFAYWYFLIKTAKDKLKKNNGVEIQSGVKYTYTFKEQSFQVISKSLSGSRKGNYKYEDIKKIYKNNVNYTFQMKDNHYMVVDISGFTDERFIDFFEKYIEKNKVKLVIKNK